MGEGKQEDSWSDRNVWWGELLTGSFSNSALNIFINVFISFRWRNTCVMFEDGHCVPSFLCVSCGDSVGGGTFSIIITYYVHVLLQLLQIFHQSHWEAVFSAVAVSALKNYASNIERSVYNIVTNIRILWVWKNMGSQKPLVALTLTLALVFFAHYWLSWTLCIGWLTWRW